MIAARSDPGFTIPWISKSSSRLCLISVAVPCAWLSPVITILFCPHGLICLKFVVSKQWVTCHWIWLKFTNDTVVGQFVLIIYNCYWFWFHMMCVGTCYSSIGNDLWHWISIFSLWETPSLRLSILAASKLMSNDTILLLSIIASLLISLFHLILSNNIWVFQDLLLPHLCYTPSA